METVASVYRLQARPEEAIVYYKKALEVAPYGPSVIKLALFAAYVTFTEIDGINIFKAPVLAMLFVGGMVPVVFSALAMSSVGKAAMLMVSSGAHRALPAVISNVFFLFNTRLSRSHIYLFLLLTLILFKSIGFNTEKEGYIFLVLS